ncbi:cytochrome c biogenesis protein ResB [Propionibacteriaceae bacterium Y1923]
MSETTTDPETPGAPEPETSETQTPETPKSETPKAGRTDQGLSPVEFLRWGWTQLTSMRTALVLLFLVALAAIPGSLIPQEAVSPIRVLDFAEANPQLDRIYRPLYLYDVYGSPWFAAIYLLLFVSLIGCILPRIKVYWRALRTPPPKIPARLTRLPEWGRGKLALSRDDALAAATQELRARRFRVVASEQGLSAERGYLRELGNLVFHLSLVVVLGAVAFNNIFTFKGTATVVEGAGFSNVITQYDEFNAGPGVDMNDLPPFSLRVNRFHAAFERGNTQRGAARLFDADITATTASGTKDVNVHVNQPLNIDGVNVHLLGHGYAAHVTVRDANGDIAFAGPVVFQPQDGNFSSFGVIKAQDARPKRLAFEGWFLPTATVDELGPRSTFPDADNPELFLNAWTGEPKEETGRPENVYVLDKTGMTQITRDGQIVSFRLKPGQLYELPDGQGSIQFDGWSRWTKLQISRSPGLPWAAGALAIGVIGLCFSLFVRPRRLWVKLLDDDQVEVGGLDRADSRAGLADDITAVLSSVSPRTHAPPEGDDA